MSSTSTIAPIVSLPKKSNKTTALTKSTASSKKSSASSNKKTPRKHNRKTSGDGHDSSSTQTESDDTDKSSISQRKKQSRRSRRQQLQKRTSAQPKLQQENSTPSLPVNMKRRRRSNSAIIYAGPHFMNDAPLPSSLPLPGSEVKATPTTSLPLRYQESIEHLPQLQPLLQFQQQHRPTLYERSLAIDNMDSKLLSSHKYYLMDPISEIQEKLRTMLKIQA